MLFKKAKEIQVCYLREDVDKMEKIPQGDWIDLRAAETISIPKGGYAQIKLGIAMKLPKGFEAHLAPRSSTFKNFGIIQTNGVAVIDESYCGISDEWMMPVYATKDTVIYNNDRICQFRIMKKQPKLKVKFVDGLLAISRGGFGSTGIK